MTNTIDIDTLIGIVAKGGRVTTGVDVYNSKGTLLLDKEFQVVSTKILETIKENGIKQVPLSADGKGGIWDAQGNLVQSNDEKPSSSPKDHESPQNDIPSATPEVPLTGIENRVHEIKEKKKLAEENYVMAKQCIKQALTDIKSTGGEFDYDKVSSQISQLTEFLTVMDNPFSYLSKEIFSHDDYLYNHSINVCTVGTMIMNKFNSIFSAMINGHLNTGTESYDPFAKQSSIPKGPYQHFQKDELKNISLGFFLHDIGKVLVPQDIINKSGKLTEQEFDTIKKHSHEFGLTILDKNKVNSPFITNIVQYHHGPLYQDEERCYPLDKQAHEIPVYTKVCKLADIYDAMTSKRSYKEASNQINAVAQIFRTYAKKDTILQYILQSFIKSIGIYPPGSIVFLRNGQMGYILETQGPLVIPFTNTQGEQLSENLDPIDLGDAGLDDSFKIDNRKSIQSPKEVYDLLPAYLKSIHSEPANVSAGVN